MTGEALLTLIVIVCMAYAFWQVYVDRRDRRRRNEELERRWFKE